MRDTKREAAKCADCGHAKESHDYSGCLCWINADAKTPCPCKVWIPSEIVLSEAGLEKLAEILEAPAELTPAMKKLISESDG